MSSGAPPQFTSPTNQADVEVARRVEADAADKAQTLSLLRATAALEHRKSLDSIEECDATRPKDAVTTVMEPINAAGEALLRSMPPLVRNESSVAEAATGGPPSAAGLAAVAVNQSPDVVVEEVDVRSPAAFQRVVISGPGLLTAEQRQACQLLRRALQLRDKHAYQRPAYYWGSCAASQHPFSPQSRPPPAVTITGTPLPTQPPAAKHFHPGALPPGVPSAAAPAPAHLATPGCFGKGPGVAQSGGSPSRKAGVESSGNLALGRSSSGSDAAAGGPLPVLGSGGGSSGGLLLPTGTGVSASEAALSALPHDQLRGSALVTLETGKDYGNLFHRRRLEPPFAPFRVPVPDALPFMHSWRDGVMEVSAPVTRLSRHAPAAVAAASSDGHRLSISIAGGAAASARDRGATASAASASGVPPQPELEASGGGGVPSQLERTTVTPTPSRDYVETEQLEEDGADADAAAKGSCAVGGGGSSGPSLFPVPPFTEYLADYAELCRITHTPFVKSFAFRRLELLEARFALHKQLNADKETMETKAVPHRDFYNVRKVDTHVHHSACMNQKHLLNFIKTKLKTCPDDVVIERDGRTLTLKEVFESLSLTAYDLSVDTLDVHADWSTFHRFDRFNLKYNPLGQSRLREIFIKTDNFIQGRYLAEITREVLEDLEAAKYSLAEYRLSIYGRSKDEWRKLAAWVVDHRLASPQMRWMIQIPRLYEAYKETGAVTCFQDMLSNIFEPLFDVTRDPSVDPKLHQFLGLCVGIDSVDDESKQEARDYGGGGEGGGAPPPPARWAAAAQPPYYYWNYFLAANVAVLNAYRAARGLTVFAFRPHSGEAGDVDHLAATFLTAEGINHGVNLRKAPTLQYLYYLAQIGLAVSPLSNNKLFVEYGKNPFYEFFAKGLSVSLSTDDPLILSYTREPLIEEYCVAAQVWKLAPTDMCEIARYSVLQSGFEHPYKAHFIGPHYAELGPEGNDIHLSNVPYIRLQYRKETLEAERELIAEGAAAAPPPTPVAVAAVAAAAAPFVSLVSPPPPPPHRAPAAAAVAAAPSSALGYRRQAATVMPVGPGSGSERIIGSHTHHAVHHAPTVEGTAVPAAVSPHAAASAAAASMHARPLEAVPTGVASPGGSAVFTIGPSTSRPSLTPSGSSSGGFEEPRSAGAHAAAALQPLPSVRHTSQQQLAQLLHHQQQAAAASSSSSSSSGSAQNPQQQQQQHLHRHHEAPRFTMIADPHPRRHEDSPLGGGGGGEGGGGTGLPAAAGPRSPGGASAFEAAASEALGGHHHPPLHAHHHGNSSSSSSSCSDAHSATHPSHHGHGHVAAPITEPSKTVPVMVSSASAASPAEGDAADAESAQAAAVVAATGVAADDGDPPLPAEAAARRRRRQSLLLAQAHATEVDANAANFGE